jgi:hypothetical protein
MCSVHDFFLPTSDLENSFVTRYIYCCSGCSFKLRVLSLVFGGASRAGGYYVCTGIESRRHKDIATLNRIAHRHNHTKPNYTPVKLQKATCIIAYLSR